MKTKITQFIILFLIIMLMYFAIEVLPLNLGQKHIPWSEIPAHIRQRLPIMLLIACAAAAYIVLGSKKKKD